MQTPVRLWFAGHLVFPHAWHSNPFCVPLHWPARYTGSDPDWHTMFLHVLHAYELMLDV